MTRIRCPGFSKPRFRIDAIKTFLLTLLVLLLFGTTLFLRFPDWTESPSIRLIAPKASFATELHSHVQQALDIAKHELAPYTTSVTSGSQAKTVKLQTYLGCLAGSNTNLNVSSSLRSIVPNLNTPCGEILSSFPLTSQSERNNSKLCDFLITKKILIVGTQTAYELHDVLLETLPSGSQGSQFRCHGPGLCTWHEICTPSHSTLRRVPKTPSSPQRHRVPPHDLSNSAILRFSLSSMVCPSFLDETNIQPYISPMTGIREYVSQDWLDKSRRSDLVIVSKPPVPAPAWSYVSSTGSSLYSRFAVRLPKVGSREWRRVQLFVGLLLVPNRDYGIVDAAWRATLVKWLPEVLETLVCLRTDNALAARRGLLVWLGSAPVEEGCPCMKDIDFESGTDWISDLSKCSPIEDRCIFENVQGAECKEIVLELLKRIF